MTDPARTASAERTEGGSKAAPGKAVRVLSGGRVVFERCEGVKDLRTGRPITPRTNFRLASVSKQFTSAAVMLLVRDGKLRYEDDLTRIFPDFPAYGRAITIHMLLNHTSGLADYEDLMPPVDPVIPVEKVQIHEPTPFDSYAPVELKEKGKGPDPLTTGVVGLAAGAALGAGVMLAKKLPGDSSAKEDQNHEKTE